MPKDSRTERLYQRIEDILIFLHFFHNFNVVLNNLHTFSLLYAIYLHVGSEYSLGFLIFLLEALGLYNARKDKSLACDHFAH